MNDPRGLVLSLAATVVESFGARGEAPREAMAAAPRLRALDASTRAAVVALANAALALARRHEFLLAGAGGFAQLPHDLRAEALVLAAAVAAGTLRPDEAAATMANHRGPALAFADLLAAESRLAAIGEPAIAFAVRHSLPDWFARAARAQFGDDATAVAAALLRPAPRTLRTNLLAVRDRDELARELAAEGIPTERGRHCPTALHVLGEADLFATAAFRRGAFEQQDEASQLAASLVLPPPRGKVLDLCAGSGGKTLAIAAALGNRGVLLATDVHEGRLARLRTRCARARAHNVQLALLAEPWPAAVVDFARTADRILVDAPCSGTGSWRRRPEARWTVTEASLAVMRSLQGELLVRAASLLRPGSRLVYATCSLLREENEDQVERLLATRPELERVRVVELLGRSHAPIADATGTYLSVRPDRHGCDGFFAAVVRAKRG